LLRNARSSGSSIRAWRPTVEYQLRDGDSLDNVVERLGATGCDDALVGIGRVGRLSLDFTREATSAEAALASALSDVKRAVPSAQLTETTLTPHS
jgi:hypothetical protein